MALSLPLSARQTSFDELGTGLFDTTFVTLDLETTGGSPDGDRITEIGAIRSRGGEITGQIDCLVRPIEPISAFVELLTGINNSMVALAPPIQEVLPTLWEFLNGTVLVAHNASFDASFLAAAFKRHGYTVPFRKSVCTLRLARWLLRGETTNLKLETLAGMIGTKAKPCHRAFADAYATFEIFHRLLELAGPHGVLTLEDLLAFNRAGSKPQLAKLSLASRIPRGAGVYRFLDIRGRVIYVGKATDLRTRVRSYFYGDSRSKVSGLVRDVASIQVERFPDALSAEVRELGLIRTHQPRYNRRGKDLGRSPAWIKLSPGSIPRFTVTRTPSAKAPPLLGPFGSVSQARLMVDAIQEAAPIPRCSDPRKHPLGCAFGQMGKCCAPCMPPNVANHAELIGAVETDLAQGAPRLLANLESKMSLFAEQMRYEEAAATRDRAQVISSAIERQRIVRCLVTARDLVVCAPSKQGGVDAVAIRQGMHVCSIHLDDAAECDPQQMLFAAPDIDPERIVQQPDIEEMLIVWRWMTKRARAGAWVAYCNGEFAFEISPASCSTLGHDDVVSIAINGTSSAIAS